MPKLSTSIGERINTFVQKYPEAAKDLGALFNVGTLVIGGKAAGKVGETAVKTGGKITEVAGKTLKGAGEKMYKIATPLEQYTARAVQAYQVAKPTLGERLKCLS